jgi:hypothetical protein
MEDGPEQEIASESSLMKGAVLSAICEVDPEKFNVYPLDELLVLLTRMTNVCPADALIALEKDGPLAPSDGNEEEADNPVSPNGPELTNDA